MLNRKIIASVAFAILILTFSSHSFFGADYLRTSNASAFASWSSSFHGVDYGWGPLGISCCANAPSVDFPVMHSLGFNLIRVPFSWNTYEQNKTAFLGNLVQLADEADNFGIHVVYDAHARGNLEPKWFFPASLAKTYGTGTSFYDAWWTGKVIYNGTGGWQAEWQDFWVPVLKTVDSHPSTLGYEIMNEPQPDGEPLSDLQNYNQFMANEFQSATSKTVVFMGPFVSLVTSSDIAVAPKGITNLVLDAHCYIQKSCGKSNVSSFQTHMSQLVNVSVILGIPVWIGEWSVCNGPLCMLSQSQSPSIVQLYNSDFVHYNFADTYWHWECEPGSQLSLEVLLAPNNCSTYWIDTQLSQYVT